MLHGAGPGVGVAGRLLERLFGLDVLAFTPEPVSRLGQRDAHLHALPVLHGPGREGLAREVDGVCHVLTIAGSYISVKGKF